MLIGVTEGEQRENEVETVFEEMPEIFHRIFS